MHSNQERVALLSMEGVAKKFVSRQSVTVALENTDVKIYPGEFVTVVGPSGCGKSTLLNLISGLMAPTEGVVRFKGQPIMGVDRLIGYITQQDNLFPWRTLRDNVAFPLELTGVSEKERYARADSWIERVGLAGFENAYPHELSGGMRQRGNIIRTLIYEPSIILMDEPFGPLDAQTRISLQKTLLSIWESTQSTVIFITHDLTEAIALGDRIFLMSARPGRIKREDTINIPRPRDVFFIHTDPEFRRLYEELWQELALEVQDYGAH